MASQPTSGDRRRRWAGPKVAVTAPPPPSGVVTANLRGSPTALRARWDSRVTSRPRITPTVVAQARATDQTAPRCIPATSLAGPAPPTPVPDEDLVVLAHRSRRLRRAVPPLRAPGARPCTGAAARPSWPRRSPRPRSSGPCALCPASVGATVASGLALPHRGQRAGEHHRKAQRQHSERGQRAARQLHDDALEAEPELDAGTAWRCSRCSGS